ILITLTILSCHKQVLHYPQQKIISRHTIIYLS
ncbi:aromatic amino acid hyroxylase biopterin-dependent domain protein, partial [Chlamydia psittaci 03DC29]